MLQVNRGAKVGIHALQASSFKWVEEAVRRGITWPVVKAVGDISWLHRVKQISPDTITIGRLAHNTDGLGEGLTGIEFVTNGDYSRYVDMLFGPIEEKIRIEPHLKDSIDFWEPVNEPDPPHPAGYRNMAECMVHCMDRAERMGIKLALFSLNAGTPEWPEILAMMETNVFHRAKSGGHIISVHEGVFKDAINQIWGKVDQWYGGAIPEDGVDGSKGNYIQLRDDGDGPYIYNAPLSEMTERPKHEYAAGPLNFRYRFWLQVLRDADLSVPFVVTEIRLGATEHYRDRLPWYDERAAQDPELLGFLPFTWSPYSSSDWGDADMEKSSEIVLNYMQSVQDRKNVVYDNTDPVDPSVDPVDPIDPVDPPVEPPVMKDTPQAVFERMMAHPSRVAVPSDSALRRKAEVSGLNVGSSELRMTVNGEDSMVILGANDTYDKYALFYTKWGEWGDDDIQVHDPKA